MFSTGRYLSFKGKESAALQKKITLYVRSSHCDFTNIHSKKIATKVELEAKRRPRPSKKLTYHGASAVQAVSWVQNTH